MSSVKSEKLTNRLAAISAPPAAIGAAPEEKNDQLPTNSDKPLFKNKSKHSVLSTTLLDAARKLSDNEISIYYLYVSF